MSKHRLQLDYTDKLVAAADAVTQARAVLKEQP